LNAIFQDFLVVYSILNRTNGFDWIQGVPKKLGHPVHAISPSCKFQLKILGDRQKVRITKGPNHKRSGSQKVRSQKVRITKGPNSHAESWKKSTRRRKNR
jgi:hypothetical protein